MVGRSNVGKSSLINALLRQRVARTSASPGKTRLANVYRVTRGAARPFYLVDLPGYGYARGGDRSARGFEALTRSYFGQVRQVGRVGRVGRVRLAGQVGQVGIGQVGQEERASQDREVSLPPASPVQPTQPARNVAALLLVDVRHPGLENDRAAWQWLQRVATLTA